MSLPAPTAQLLRFGDFELDLQTEELRRGGVRVKIQEQPFRILLALVLHRGDLVTREDLRRELWADDTFVDFDTGLNRSIAKLREALEDSSEAPRYIRTIPRKGYRFIAPVEAVAPPAELPRPSTTAVPASRGRRSIMAVLALVVLAGTAYLIPNLLRRPPVGAREGRFMLVVLPFENLTGDPGQEFFSDGITEEIITQLGQLPVKELGIIARTSAMKYKNSSKDVAEIARELHVDYIVEGSVRRQGNRVRIAVQLIRASDQTHLWADTYDRDVANVLSTQAEIARTVGSQLQLHLGTGSELSAGQAPPQPQREPDPAAYESYLRGRSYVSAGFDTPQALRRAQAYFEKSIREDPYFGQAYAGLAESYVLLSEFRWVSPNEAYPPARQAIDKALQLDNRLGDAYIAWGWLSWRHDWNWSAAEKQYRYACELNPNDVDAHQALAWFLAWSRRGAAARSEIEKIRRLDPAQAFAIDEAGIYYHSRDYKSLVAAGQKSLALRGDFWISHYFLGVGYEGTGRLSDAVREYRAAVEISQGDTDAAAALGHAYALAGKRSDAAAILQGMLQSARTTYLSPYMIAAVYAGLGDKDRAFQFLEKAYQERSTDLPYFLQADLRMDALRSDPRLREIEQRLRLPR